MNFYILMNTIKSGSMGQYKDYLDDEEKEDI